MVFPPSANARARARPGGPDDAADGPVDGLGPGDHRKPPPGRSPVRPPTPISCRVPQSSVPPVESAFGNDDPERAVERTLDIDGGERPSRATF